MKKTTLFTMLTMLLLFVSSNVWADDEPFYTLETVPFTEGTNHTDYNKYFDDEHDGMIWNAPGNQSMDGRWRIGGKSDYVPMSEGLRTCLTHFVEQHRSFRTIDWHAEAWMDRQTGERAALSECKGWKDKVKYILCRYTPFLHYYYGV